MGSVHAAPPSFRKAVAVAGFARVLRQEEGFDVGALDDIIGLAKGSVGDDPLGPDLLLAMQRAEALMGPELHQSSLLPQ